MVSVLLLGHFDQVYLLCIGFEVCWERSGTLRIFSCQKFEMRTPQQLARFFSFVIKASNNWSKMFLNQYNHKQLIQFLKGKNKKLRINTDVPFCTDMNSRCISIDLISSPLIFKVLFAVPRRSAGSTLDHSFLSCYSQPSMKTVFCKEKQSCIHGTCILWNFTLRNVHTSLIVQNPSWNCCNISPDRTVFCNWTAPALMYTTPLCDAELL